MLKRLIHGARGGWYRARATVAAEGLFTAAGESGAKLANAAVAHAWDAYAPMLDGRHGPRPRHEVVAVFALALAIHHGAFGTLGQTRMVKALAAGIGEGGLYRHRSREWTGAVETELLAFARAVNADPSAPLREPGASA